MKTFVVDASVAVKWLLPPGNEPFAAEARRLLDLYVANQLRMIVPDLFWAEIGNVLWKAAVRGRISVQNAASALSSMLTLGLRSAASLDLVASALPVALTHRHSIYDLIYLLAAMEARAEFITADEKLVNALGTRFPVRWLGALGNLIP